MSEYEVRDPVIGKRKKYRFLLSSFTQEERQELTKAIVELGGVCIDTPHYIISSTHIVSKKPNRGEKYLCGSAAGKWILRKEYIEDSKKAQRWLDEEKYEWNDQCTYEGLPSGHVSAPSRWRKSFQHSHTGPFHGWRAIVILKDIKKRNAYRCLLEVGQATILNAKGPFNSSIVKKTTHVFVEKSLEDEVQCFSDAGVPCLSPDYIPEYILQDPKPEIQEYYISQFSCVSSTCAVKRGLPSRYNTPIFPVGESNIPKTKSRIQDYMSGGQKRMTSYENHPSPPKKHKQATSRVEVFPKWLEWYSGNPVSGIDERENQNKPNNSKASKGVSTFPPHITNAIDSYLEEDGHQAVAVSVIRSFLSSTRYPSSVLVNTMMTRLLLKATSPQLANKTYTALQLLLALHPPPVRSNLYYHAMCSPTLTSDKDVKLKSTAWEYLHMVFRQSLGCTDGNGAISVSSQLRNNCLMLMKFLCSVIEKDFYTIMESKDIKIDNVNKCRKTLLWKVFWPDGQLVVNCAIRNLLKLTWLSACQSNQDSSLSPVLHSLQEMVSMVAVCFEFMDQSFMGDHYNSGVVSGPRMTSLATEMVLTCGRTHKQEDGLRTLLQSLQATWLKVHILDMILSSYNDCLVPQQYKLLMPKQLSMEKIVSCYFYLLPMDNISSQGDITENMDVSKRNTVLTLITDANRYHGNMEKTSKTTEKPKKNPLNRRNTRGETPLHTAAIKNEPFRIRELITSGADVNLTDYAGWTPLHEACNHGNIKCVEEILKVRPLLYNPSQKGLTGLDILSSPLCGTTPLHDAVANNHINVAKMLVSAGGLPLLQAKTSRGETPVDLSCSEEMVDYLRTAENNLNNLSTHQDTQLIESQQRLVPDSVYRRVLGQRGSKTSKHISPEKCEEYMLLISQLLQGYTRLQCEHIDNEHTSEREDLMSNHVDNLQHHLQAICSDSRLTFVCKARLENIKLL